MTRHQYGTSALVPQTSFPGGTSDGNVSCFLRLFKILAYTDCLELGKDTGLVP